MNFFDKLSGAIAQNNSLLCVRLDPDLELGKQVSAIEALSVQQQLHALIHETADLVCAYKIIPEFYLAFGADGLTLLQEILAAIPPQIPVILDAKYAHLNTSSTFAQTIFQDWQVDAVTLSPYAGQDVAAPFLMYADKAVFVLCATANPSAALLQMYPTPDSPLCLELVREAKTWGTIEHLGFEVGATPDLLSRIRSMAPERLLLLQDTWTDDLELVKMVSAGLNPNGDGLIVLVPKELLAHPQPAESIRSLCDQINQVREDAIAQNPSCDLWLPNVALSHQHRHEDLILQLFDIGCLQFGEFVQASGAVFPYYIDLRTIISNPQIFDAVISAYAEVLKTLTFDRVAGIPYGSLPTATGLSLRLNRPMIFPRKEVKAHGTRRLVEGAFYPGETAVVVDDILITGKSAIEGAEKLKSVGLQVSDIVVFIDHEQGVMDTLQTNGFRGHAVLTLSEIADTLHETNRITTEQRQRLSDCHASHAGD